MIVVVKFQVRLNTAKETALFVNVCMHYDCDIDCKARDSNIVFDAKSIMGMVNLVGKDVDISFNCSDRRVIELFKDDIQLWIIKE